MENDNRPSTITDPLANEVSENEPYVGNENEDDEENEIQINPGNNDVSESSRENEGLTAAETSPPNDIEKDDEGDLKQNEELLDDSVLHTPRTNVSEVTDVMDQNVENYRDSDDAHASKTASNSEGEFEHEDLPVAEKSYSTVIVPEEQPSPIEGELVENDVNHQTIDTDGQQDEMFIQRTESIKLSENEVQAENYDNNQTIDTDAQQDEMFIRRSVSLKLSENEVQAENYDNNQTIDTDAQQDEMFLRRTGSIKLSESEAHPIEIPSENQYSNYSTAELILPPEQAAAILLPHPQSPKKYLNRVKKSVMSNDELNALYGRSAVSEGNAGTTSGNTHMITFPYLPYVPQTAPPIVTRVTKRPVPNVIKLSNVVVTARKRAQMSRGSASVYYEPNKKPHKKVASWEQCHNHRPPLQFDMEGPSPGAYSPRNKPLNESNSPAFTFGMKIQERDGGSRTAWAKSWFSSPDTYTYKVDYGRERQWPSPFHYQTRSAMGKKNMALHDFPAFSMRSRTGGFRLNKKGSEKEPSPSNYNPGQADRLVRRSAPAFSFSARTQPTTLGQQTEKTPGPGNYNPKFKELSSKASSPAFTVCGIRKEKRHNLGPHTTL